LVVQIIINHRFKVDRIDRLFYALLPLVGYLLGLIAAVLLVMQAAASANLIAAAVMTLLFAAIRNAWDMMVWIVIKTPSGGMPPP
jgi:cobalamin synthase